ncbi:MAG: hypothetical protein CL943_02490 [Candidatus Diapherotrites archaeon]|uniref:DOD-type homing endonuclease domain-containing protein n=1 Tax=Candidatus Iainarchaeum sp. TaxID=3101447 RepID=A0A2D6M144_9ARCH|nr:hypothetical protein [Candidatus Diapherotrites archaeon]|tara:strand:+ start:270 stop:1409 length:1140 start_codon:yes stop_codon:yes gene_type:complete
MRNGPCGNRIYTLKTVIRRTLEIYSLQEYLNYKNQFLHVQEKRVKLLKEDLTKLFGLIRTSAKYKTWEKLTMDVGTGSTSLKSFRRGERSITEKVFEQLLKYLDNKQKEYFLNRMELIDLYWGAKKGGSVSIQLTKERLGEEGFLKRLEKVRACRKNQYNPLNKSRLPKLDNPELYELFGAMLGDGSSGKYFSKWSGYYIYASAIVGNAKKDVEYIHYLVSIIRRHFNLKPYTCFRKDNSFRLQLNSRLFYEWLVSIGYPSNGKPKNFGMPEYIMNLSNEKVNFILRGLLDTDGHVNARKDEKFRYPYVTICSSSQTLRNQIKNILRRQGFPAFIHAENVSIRGINNTHRWFNLIGSSNSRILNKYKEFCETDKIYPGL